MSRSSKLAIVTFLCLAFATLLPFVSRQLSAEGQDNGRSVMRITEDTTLHVFNDGSMETAGGSGVEFIPLNTDAVGAEPAVGYTGAVEEIPVTRVKTTSNSLEETVQLTAAEDEFVTITYIASGTLSIAPDGTWLTEDGGRVEFIRMSRAEYEALADAASTEPETVTVEVVPIEPNNNNWDGSLVCDSERSYLRTIRDIRGLANCAICAQIWHFAVETRRSARIWSLFQNADE